MTVRTDERVRNANEMGAPARPDGWPRWAVYAAWALLAVGAVMRVARFLHFRSLWMDELYLAESILTRGFHDLLFVPLRQWQTAPAGFLLCVRACVSLFGPGERSLRATSLVFSLGSLPLFYAVARRSLPVRGTLTAIALFATLGPLVYYANELKQYSCDVTVTLAILLAAMRFEQSPTVRRLATLVAVGAVGIFFSQPAVFVLAGVGTVLFARRWMQGREPLDRFHSARPWIAARPVALAAAIWLTVFAVNYALFLRPVMKDASQYAGLVQYWVNQNGFMPTRPLAALPWLWETLVKMCRDPGAMWLPYGEAAAAAFLIGFLLVVRSIRTGRAGVVRHGLLLLSPLPFVLAASAARRYPFGDRLVLFMVPAVILLISAAIDALAGAGPVGLAAAAVLLGMILVPSADRAVGYLVAPPGREETRPLYVWLAARYQPGDTLCFSHEADESFEHYKDEVGLGSVPKDPRHFVVLPHFSEKPREYYDDLDALRGRPRVWVIMAHIWTVNGLNEEQYTLAVLDRMGGVCIAGHHEWDANAYLYDMSGAEAPQNPAQR